MNIKIEFGHRPSNLSMAARAFDRILNVHKLRGIRLYPPKTVVQDDPDQQTLEQLSKKFQAGPVKQRMPIQLRVARKSAFELQISRDRRQRSLSKPEKYPAPGAYNPRRYMTKLPFQMRKNHRFGNSCDLTQMPRTPTLRNASNISNISNKSYKKVRPFTADLGMDRNKTCHQYIIN